MAQVEGRPPAGSVAKKYPGAPIPQYMSCYMQLLAGVHPAYAMDWIARGGSPYPTLFAPTEETVEAWLREFEVEHDEVRRAFGYGPKGEVRRHSVTAIGNDPVRWMLLRLMARDKRCGATVGRHGPERNPAAQPSPAVVVTPITTTITPPAPVGASAQRAGDALGSVASD
jgi:hypothetical protein